MTRLGHLLFLFLVFRVFPFFVMDARNAEYFQCTDYTTSRIFSARTGDFLPPLIGTSSFRVIFFFIFSTGEHRPPSGTLLLLRAQTPERNTKRSLVLFAFLSKAVSFL